MLLKENQIIEIPFRENFDLISQVYLNLLIEDDPDVINYKCPFKLIEKLYYLQTKEEKSNNFRAIILAKIILTLMDNNEQNEDLDSKEKPEKKFSEFKKYNKDLIDANKELLEKYGLTPNDILSKKMDEIYLAIIKHLIIKKQLNESENTIKLLESINIESFDITKTIFDGVKIILDNENYIKKYEIIRFEHIFDKDIISFYYVLFRYILKNKVNIYQITFFCNARTKVINLIKKNVASLKENLGGFSYKDKVEYVLKYFMFFKYYYYEYGKLKDEGFQLNTSDYFCCKNVNRNTRERTDESKSYSKNSEYFGSSFNIEKENSHRKFNNDEEQENQ